MSGTDRSIRSNRIRTAIHAHIKARLDSKLEQLRKLEKSMKIPEDVPRRAKLISQHEPTVWLKDAARRARQIKIVTHILKATHPDARGTEIYVPPKQLPSHNEIGSHALGNVFVEDVVGSAGALDVYKLLKLEIDGRRLLDVLLEGDDDALHALDDDVANARQLRESFISLTQHDRDRPASHPFSKQLYWLVDNDPADDLAYHLLAPLFATSLVHAIHSTVHEDVSSKTNKLARQAYYGKRYHDGVFRDYTNLAAKKIGGTQPQNISQLNGERLGINYLLSCAPPPETYDSTATRVNHNADSINPTPVKREGLLILPNLNIQNANAISSSVTHGFPSMTAFIGLMWALERKMAAAGIGLGLNAVGVICHNHQEQTVKNGEVYAFCQPRHPLNKMGKSAAIVEEGRMHMDITLIFAASWKEGGAGKNVFMSGMEEARNALEQQIAQHVASMRVAGGNIISSNVVAQLLPSKNSEQRTHELIQLRKRPGFTLVSRAGLLHSRLQEMQAENTESTLLDAWIDLSRLNWRPAPTQDGKKQPNGKVRWENDRTGWIVPIPIGYSALVPLHDAGSVANARDTSIPFCFVENLYSVGQWLRPYYLNDVDSLLWYAESLPEHGLYRLRNNYVPDGMIS